MAQSPEREPEEAIIVALFDIANHLARGGERLARLAGLTTQQWLVLLEIAGDPSFQLPRGRRSASVGVLPSEIAEARGVTRATVSVLVAQLEALGLIRDIADPEDGRRRRFVVTPAGERALAQVEPERLAANRRLLAPFTTRDREQLLVYLKTVRDVLVEASGERSDRDPPPPPRPAAPPRRSRGPTSRGSRRRG